MKPKLRIILTIAHLYELADKGYVDFTSDSADIRVRTDNTYLLTVTERKFTEDFVKQTPPNMVN